MLPPFAACEQAANAAVIGALANALVRIGGEAGKSITGIFDQEYVVADVSNPGMAASTPAVTVPTAAVPSPAIGLHVEISTATGTSQWRLVEHHPDGSGLSLLLLERAA